MAYVDQPAMSTRKIVSIGLVVLLHALLGYALITGLAINVVKKVAKDLSVVDVKDEPPPPVEKPPPPPPEQKVEPPPMVTPPPIVSPPISTPAPALVQVPVAPPPQIHVEAPQAPPPPAPPRISQAAGAKGDPAQWVTTDDYPSAALREERQGVVKVSWQINEQGKIENCQVVSSSGSPDLDEATCRLLTRRGKYSPAKDENGNPMRSTSSRSVRWQIPKD